MGGCLTGAADASDWVAQAVVDCWVASVFALRSCGESGEEAAQDGNYVATMVDASHYKVAFVEARTDEEAGLEAASSAAMLGASTGASTGPL